MLSRGARSAERRVRLAQDEGGRADEALLELVYDELRAIAAAKLRGEHGRASLQTTDLVHEAWMRLAEQRKLDWTNREQFSCLAARAIRRILVDRARARNALKRGGGATRVSWDEERVGADVGKEELELDVVALDEALARLAADFERAANVVELRYFGGLSVAETANALALSERTVELDWAFARAWLRRELSGDPGMEEC